MQNIAKETPYSLATSPLTFLSHQLLALEETVSSVYFLSNAVTRTQSTNLAHTHSAEQERSSNGRTGKAGLERRAALSWHPTFLSLEEPT